MLPRIVILALALAALATLGLAACGSEEGEDGAGAEPAARGDRPAKLPQDWERRRNRRAGFTVGVPPRWGYATRKRTDASAITSPDRLAVMSITADRSDAALELPLEEFARSTAEALAGEQLGARRFRRLEVGTVGALDHFYEAAVATARGRVRGAKVDERVLVTVLRREGDVSFVAVARQNAKRRSKVADRSAIARIIRTIRSAPPRDPQASGRPG